MKRFFFLLIQILWPLTVQAETLSQAILSIQKSDLAENQVNVEIAIGESPGIVGLQFDLQFNNSSLELESSRFCSTSQEELLFLIENGGIATFCRIQDAPNDDFIRFLILDFSLEGLDPGILGTLRFINHDSSNQPINFDLALCSALIVEKNGSQRLLSPEEYSSNAGSLIGNGTSPPRPLDTAHIYLDGPSIAAEPPFLFANQLDTTIQQLKTAPNEIELFLPNELAINLTMTHFEARSGYVKLLDCSNKLAPDPNAESQMSFTWEGEGDEAQMKVNFSDGVLSGEIVTADRAFKLSFGVRPYTEVLALNPPRVTVPLPNASPIVVHREEFHGRHDGFMWQGSTIDGSTRVLITSINSGLYATIASSPVEYVVIPSQADSHSINKSGQSRFSCINTEQGQIWNFSPGRLNHEIGSNIRVNARNKRISSDDRSIDVGFFLSQNACDVIFSDNCSELQSNEETRLALNNHIRLFAQSRIDLANLALSLKESKYRLTLAHFDLLEYDSFGDIKHDSEFILRILPSLSESSSNKWDLAMLSFEQCQDVLTLSPKFLEVFRLPIPQ